MHLKEIYRYKRSDRRETGYAILRSDFCLHRSAGRAVVEDTETLEKKNWKKRNIKEKRKLKIKVDEHNYIKRNN